MFDMEGLPDLLKPCGRGCYEPQERADDNFQLIQVNRELTDYPTRNTIVASYYYICMS